MATMDYKTLDLSAPIISEALELARKLNYHCKVNNLSRIMMLDGVVVDGEAYAKSRYEKGLAEGRAFERGRILGVLEGIK